MPFAFDLLDEEQKKKDDPSADSQGAAPAMTGGGQSFSGGSGGAPQGAAPAQSGTSKQGSGFVNLDKYMSANQGNDFGNQVTGKVQGDVSQAKQTLGSSAQDFTDASNKGTTSWGNVGDTVKGIVDNAGDKTSADDVSNYQKYAKATYQGPESFTGSAYGTKAQGANTKATQEAGALQSEGGRFALLDQFYGRPNYSTGEKSLDNLLVQSAPGVAARAASLGSQAGQLTGQMGQTAQQLDNLATSNKFATQDTAKQTQDYLNNATTGFQTDLDKRYADYNSANDTYNKGIQGDISDDKLSDDTLAQYGLKAGDNLYDVNLSKYLNTMPTQASEGQFASDQDYAKYLALSQLAGEDPSYLTADNRAQAGTAAGMGRDTVDKTGLARDITSAQGEYTSKDSDLNTQLSPVVSQISTLQNMISQLQGQPGQINRLDGSAAPGSTLQMAQEKLAAAQQQAAALQAQRDALASLYGSNRKVSKA